MRSLGELDSFVWSGERDPRGLGRFYATPTCGAGSDPVDGFGLADKIARTVVPRGFDSIVSSPWN